MLHLYNVPVPGCEPRHAPQSHTLVSLAVPQGLSFLSRFILLWVLDENHHRFANLISQESKLNHFIKCPL